MHTTYRRASSTQTSFTFSGEGSSRSSLLGCTSAWRPARATTALASVELLMRTPRMYCHPRSSTAARVAALIIPRSATMQTDPIPNRFFNRSTMGTRLFTSAVLPGHSSVQSGLPSWSSTMACWCESRDRRPSPRPCMSWRSCGAICAGMCSRRRRRKAWARRSTMRRRQAWIALLRYGSGVPWYRLQGLEKSLGIPLPVATQCEIVAETAVILQPALQELTRQAAQGEVVHNDDTSMRVLSLDRDADISPDRTGVFTSGVVWIFQERRIALFFTGCKHAGENLAEVLKQRPTDLPPPIQMCDALSRNVPKSFATLLANCMAH